MALFITAVLTAAGFQSFARLALLPRRWEFPAAAALIPLPFFFEERIARTSLAALDGSLSGAGTLGNWCALVVIQELFALTAGFSLLADFESGTKGKRWKYAVFLPSALLPAGALYLQTRLFNALPGFEFRTITLWLAAGLPAAGIAVTESVRLLRRDRETRILAVLHIEWALILGAVFLPVAATARLTAENGSWSVIKSLSALGILAIPVLLSATGFHLYFIYQGKKRHVNRHTNS